MIRKKFIIRLDEAANIEQIRIIATEDELFAFSRKLRMYCIVGLFTVPLSIREAMQDQLDKIYRSL